MSVITLPAATLASCSDISFDFNISQEVTKTLSGVAQITTYPDRWWSARLQVNPRHGSDILAWSLALDRIADRINVVAIAPPYYSGPSTGYAGSNPLVNGADQLGFSLAVDGLPNSTAILVAGDFISFDTTSVKGNTNRQLIKVLSNVSSNGSGEATIPLVAPIRQAPANNATVNILTPSAFFMSVTPRSSVNLVPGKFSSFTIDLEERIYP